MVEFVCCILMLNVLTMKNKSEYFIHHINARNLNVHRQSEIKQHMQYETIMSTYSTILHNTHPRL